MYFSLEFHCNFLLRCFSEPIAQVFFAVDFLMRSGTSWQPFSHLASKGPRPSCRWNDSNTSFFPPQMISTDSRETFLNWKIVAWLWDVKSDKQLALWKALARKRQKVFYSEVKSSVFSVLQLSASCCTPMAIIQPPISCWKCLANKIKQTALPWDDNRKKPDE